MGALLPESEATRIAAKVHNFTQVMMLIKVWMWAAKWQKGKKVAVKCLIRLLGGEVFVI